MYKMSSTLYYMSPEMINFTLPIAIEEFKGNISEKSDIYAFGVLLYKMFSKKYPFEGNLKEFRQKVFYEKPPRLEIDEELWRIIDRCLQKNIDRRYKGFNNIIEDIELLTEFK